MRRLLNMAADTLRRWRERPWDMVREEFKAEPDWHQMQLLRAFANTDRAELVWLELHGVLWDRGQSSEWRGGQYQ
jgi:hypothetical protein